MCAYIDFKVILNSLSHNLKFPLRYLGTRVADCAVRLRLSNISRLKCDNSLTLTIVKNKMKTFPVIRSVISMDTDRPVELEHLLYLQS